MTTDLFDQCFDWRDIRDRVKIYIFDFSRLQHRHRRGVFRIKRVGNSLEAVECFLEHLEHLFGVVAQHSRLGATGTQEIIINGAVFVNDGAGFILDMNNTGTDVCFRQACMNCIPHNW